MDELKEALKGDRSMDRQEFVLRVYDDALDRLSTLLIVLADDARQAQDRETINHILERHDEALKLWRELRVEKALYAEVSPA